MGRDLIRYDLLTQEAMRMVVREALVHVAREGLPGNHHFFIAFQTTHPDVEISDALLARYPDEMTIVLQHQFWDLEVTAAHFRVNLSFNGIIETLKVPFSAVKSFFDPSVPFGLQFHPSDEMANGDLEAAEEAPAMSAQGAGAARQSDGAASVDSGGAKPPADVVNLDAFRKK